MNLKCKGNWFRVGAHAYYECLWDGVVLKDNSPIQGSTCPNCNRTVDGVNFGNAPIATKTVRQAYLKPRASSSSSAKVRPLLGTREAASSSSSGIGADGHANV